MRQVFLTSGPRGSGKSTYVEALCERRSDLVLVSRDRIMLDLFGTVWCGAYSGTFEHSMQVMLDQLSVALQPENAQVVLDCWNGFSTERLWLVRRLRELGADRVTCLFFMISSETCVQWYMKKPEWDRGGLSEHSVRHDHELFYQEAQTIGQDGFDHIIEVRPEEPELFDPIP